MRILFFSDVHGSPGALKKLEKHIADLHPDRLVLLGDALYHGPRNPLPDDYDPKSTASILNTWKRILLCVRGNCDSEVDQMMLEFPLMADYSMLFADGKTFFLTHGHHFSPERLPPLSDGDVFAYGHTHIPQNEMKNALTLFNPGSITFPKGGNAPSFGFFSNGVLSVKTL